MKSINSYVRLWPVTKQRRRFFIARLAIAEGDVGLICRQNWT
jgi:hypothetical protein